MVLTEVLLEVKVEVNVDVTRSLVLLGVFHESNC